MKRIGLLTSIFALLLFLPFSASAQSGKITGRVLDGETGSPLPGVNVLISGTTQGATTDADGYYNILNVSPGTYNIRASFVGYARTVQEDVEVNAGLTTEVIFELQEQTEELDEVIVQAQEPVVKRDVSANVANISSVEMGSLPVSGVSEVINLQAGVEPGMQVRGGGLNEIDLVVDGMSMSGGRSNEPFTNISYTSVEQVQVQTGGFNAEYGNVRSGLINVTTKDGPRDHYVVNALVRYSSPSQEHFGPLPNDPNGWYMEPYLDNPNIPNESDPAFVGTHSDESAWDSYTRQTYPEFEGWNKVAETLKGDDNSANDLTPQQLIEVFNWRTRKDPRVKTPNYDLDASIGGPVPVVGKYLGDLRFMASARHNQEAYFVPVARKAYEATTGQLKMTSNIASSMRLDLMGMYATEYGLNGQYHGWPTMITGEQPRYPWDGRGALAGVRVGKMQIFGSGQWIPMDVTRGKLGGEFTHTLSSNSFYEVSFQRSETNYDTYPSRRRNRDKILATVGEYELDEAPFGYDPEPGQSDPAGDGFLGGGGKGRDTSTVVQWQGGFDLTSQLNRFMQFKTGIEYIYGDYNISFGRRDSFHVHHSNPKFRFHRFPSQGGTYAQTKLEFEGMVANVGLRLDYFHAGDKWYDYKPFDRAFTARSGADNLDENLEQTPIERQFSLSPRLGVSFPASEVSKIYFNYGHFRQMLDPFDLFVVENKFKGQVGSIGNPEHPMPKTVAYEIGYEQSFFDQYLIRLAGYYRDISLQSRNITYNSLDNLVNYNAKLPFNYEDIRGFEVTVRKNRGKWLRGFVNYTYMARKGGNYGYGQQFENRLEQRRYERNAREYQFSPIPEPYARFNLIFLAPNDLGPSLGSVYPIGGWRVSVLGSWRQGQVFTWTGGQGGGNQERINNNVSWRDYYNLDLRLSKNIETEVGRVKVFADVSNLLNIRHLQRRGPWAGSFNFQKYMNSLHLPEDVFAEAEGGKMPYDFIPGNDQPGDYRKPGTEWVPVEMVSELPGEGVQRWGDKPGPLYYLQGEKAYYSWDGSSFQKADKEFVDQVLENKQYIFMPNQRFSRFLNPRDVYFGLEINF